MLAIASEAERGTSGKLAVVGIDIAGAAVVAVAVDIAVAVGMAVFSGSIGIRCRFERSIDKVLSRIVLMMDCKLIAFDRLDWSLAESLVVEPFS